MTGLENRVRDLLAQRAEQATVSDDAWERIERRIEARPTPRAWWRLTGPQLATGLATATVAAIAVAGGASLLSGDPTVQVDPFTPEVERVVDPRPGTGWDRASGPVDAPGTEGELSVNDVFADDRVVLVAADGGNLWRSTDEGDSFVRVKEDAFAPIDGAGADLRAVTATGHAYLVAGAVGGHGVIFRSPDGASFERVEVSDAGPLADVGVAPGVVVAVGRDAQGAAAFLSEDDGRTWERAVMEEPAAAGDAGLDVVVHGPTGWVAAGSEAGAVEHTTMWFSEDGQAWERTSTLGAGRIAVLVIVDEGYLALRTNGEILVSHDGRGWEKQYVRIGQFNASDDAAGPLRFVALDAVAGDWVALGGTIDLDEPPRAFISSDTRLWESEPIDARGDVRAIAVLPDGTAIAAGRADACWDRDTCPPHQDELRIWHRTR